MEKRVVDGVEINEHGGKQSYIGTCFTCIPGHAIERVAKVLEHGKNKYGRDNWRLIPIDEQIEHALKHIYAYLYQQGETNEDDLAHAVTRLLFALELDNVVNSTQADTEDRTVDALFNDIVKINGIGMNQFIRNNIWRSLNNGDAWVINPQTQRYVKLDSNRSED